MSHKHFLDDQHNPACMYNPEHVVESFHLARQRSLPDFVTPLPVRQLISMTEPDSMTVTMNPHGTSAVEYYSSPLKTIVQAEPYPLDGMWTLSSWTVSGANDDDMVKLALSISRLDNAPPMLQTVFLCPTLSEGNMNTTDTDYRDGHAVGAAIIRFAQESQLTAAVTCFAEPDKLTA